MTEETTTYFAPTPRQKPDVIEYQSEQVIQNKELADIFQSLPYIVMIINHERQMVFGNAQIESLLGVDEYKQALGLRPGEILHCINSNKMEGGCGTSKACRYCGAVNTILKSQQSGEKVTGECRISSEVDGKTFAYDLQITAYPISLGEKIFTVLFMSDISPIKSKERLERTFFHDIINSSGGVLGILKYFPNDGLNEKQLRILKTLKTASSDLLDEIQSQRDLVAAEEGRLNVDWTKLNSLDVIHHAIQGIKHHQVFQDINIEIVPNIPLVEFNSDLKILRRILINLLKNAAEANASQSPVIIGCIASQQSIKFWVKNDVSIPESIKLQLFQRSFSTKGKGRGIGTYSIKLFTEEYLQGKVSLESASETGTVFTIELPLHPNEN